MAAYVYILASKRNGTLYIGVTSDLLRRMSEHRDGLVGGFTRKYGVNVGLLRGDGVDHCSHPARKDAQALGAALEWRDLWDEIGRG